MVELSIPRFHHLPDRFHHPRLRSRLAFRNSMFVSSLKCSGEFIFNNSYVSVYKLRVIIVNPSTFILRCNETWHPPCRYFSRHNFRAKLKPHCHGICVSLNKFAEFESSSSQHRIADFIHRFCRNHIQRIIFRTTFNTCGCRASYEPIHSNMNSFIQRPVCLEFHPTRL